MQTLTANFVRSLRGSAVVTALAAAILLVGGCATQHQSEGIVTDTHATILAAGVPVVQHHTAAPRRRRFALGLNGVPRHLAGALGAATAGFLEANLGIRPVPFVLAEGLAACGFLLSLLARETTGHVKLESAGAPPTRSLTKLLLDVSFRDRPMSSACQAGMVNNPKDGMVWARLPMPFAPHGCGPRESGLLAGAYSAV